MGKDGVIEKGKNRVSKAGGNSREINGSEAMDYMFNGVLKCSRCLNFEQREFLGILNSKSRGISKILNPGEYQKHKSRGILKSKSWRIQNIETYRQFR